MMAMRLSNSKDAARAVCITGQSEPVALAGIYIGKTERYALPFFLDLDALVSPHVTIIGMSGAGKSYLMKSLAARAGIYGGIGATVIDWNGEYSGIVSAFGKERLCTSDDRAAGLAFESLGNGRDALSGFNLSAIETRGEREATARSILSAIVDSLARRERGDGVRHIIILDEAWKVVHGGEIGMLFREARKYGIAIIAASQAANDVSSEIISNASCIMAFRMQSEADFSALLKSEVIDAKDATRIATLNVGECLVITKLKVNAGIPSKVVISRVDGIHGAGVLAIRDGDVEFEVRAEKMASETALLSDDERVRAGVYGFIGERKEIDLTAFISLLRELGLGRAAIVAYLRRLGVDDMCIVKAYSESSCIAFEG